MNDLLRIGPEPIEITEIQDALTDPACGAQLIFIGAVRNHNEGRAVEAVNYEAFIPLAQTLLSELVVETRAQVGQALQIAIALRIGTLAVGEVSTVIGVASPHRAESYQASQFLIEQIKIRLPIWKEEHYKNEQSRWLDGAQLSAKDCSGNLSRRAVVPHGPR